MAKRSKVNVPKKKVVAKTVARNQVVAKKVVAKQSAPSKAAAIPAIKPGSAAHTELLAHQRMCEKYTWQALQLISRSAAPSLFLEA